MLMLERLKTSKQDDVRSEPREVGPSPQPPLLLFLQGEIGQVPQTHYNAITSDLPYQGAISAYLLRSARATHL
jgi:hypothetical protein